MIKQQLDQDLKQAMLAGDKRLVSVIRGIKSVILDAEIKSGSRDQGLGDQEAVALLQKEAKKRAEAAELYKNAGESERADQETYEKSILDGYLPEMMDEEQINKLIDEVIADLGGTPDKSRMGQLIGAVKGKSKGQADGAVIAKLVQQRLQ